MKLFLFILLLGYNLTFGQTNSVTYNVIVNDPSIMWGTRDAYELNLYSDGYNSLEYRKDCDTLLVQQDGLIIETKQKYFSDSLKFKRIKNLDKKIIEYTKYNNQVHVKDTVNIKFKSGTKVKNILGLSCNQLFFSFRGRHYEAFYTTEILIPDGPYKFIGAPGLILEVTSFDESVKIKAKSISNNISKSNSDNFSHETNFKNAKYIVSYDDYIKAYLDQWYEIITKNESEYEGLTSSFNSRRIEILPNKLDPDYENKN